MPNTVDGITTLFDYFQERVEAAQQGHGLLLSADTSLYLAALLTERVRTDRPAPPEQTLAELHAAAAGAPPTAQVRTYRELGDRALYLLGYFKESLARRPVGLSYYEDMGSAAYHRVDMVFKRWFQDAFGPVFAELGDRFHECVELLQTIRSHHDEQPDTLGRLYEDWVRTGSPEAAARLRTMGLLLPPRPVET